MKFKSIILLALFSTLASCGQSVTNEIDNIYSFKPSKLTDKERELKMPALDGFWEKVKSDTLKNLPMLRKELQANGHNPFFYYDGSGLLLSLTNNKADKELAIEAISKCDLDDISQKMFVMTLNGLANEGFDVTKPAVKILYEEDYSFYISQHAMMFNQGYCLTYMLVPQKNDNYVDTLTTIFKSLKTPAQKAIVTTLWFSYTCKGDIFLKSVIENNTLDKEVREYATRIMGYTKLSKEQQEYLKLIGKDELGNLRAEALKSFSDESIDALDMTTRIQRKENNCH
jgi:hypothetical protein